MVKINNKLGFDCWMCVLYIFHLLMRVLDKRASSATTCQKYDVYWVCMIFEFLYASRATCCLITNRSFKQTNLYSLLTNTSVAENNLFNKVLCVTYDTLSHNCFCVRILYVTESIIRPQYYKVLAGLLNWSHQLFPGPSVIGVSDVKKM